MIQPSRTVLSAAVLALLLGACQRDETAAPADPSAATPAAQTPAADEAATAPAASGNAYCSGEPGTAPRGELVAQRISGADGDGSKGLYEGPVWNGQALYFSDFQFADGFPSKIRRLGADGRLETAIEASGSNG